MLRIPVGIFAVTALGGLIMAFLHFRDRQIPLLLAVGHGLLGACGLLTLGWAVFRLHPGGNAPISLGIFIVTALGGFFLFSFQVRGLRLPSWGVIVHALAAVTGFALLAFKAFKG